MSSPSELDAEDAKLVTLARGARARIGAPTGAAVRDDTGRTYAAADVTLTTLRLPALDLAVALAWTSGARGIEAIVVVGADSDPSLTVAAEVGGTDVPVILCTADGMVVRRITT